MTEPTVKHIANVQISYELFRDMFDFPENTQIIAARVDTYNWGKLIITIENEELPAVEEGHLIPIAIPSYVTFYDENGKAAGIMRQDWGIR